MKVSMKLPRLMLLGAITATMIGTSAGGAAAATSSVQSITTVLSGTPSQSPPFLTTATGSYTATSASGTIVDSSQPPQGGSIVAVARIPINPPNSTQIQSVRTITSPNGTLRLRCTEVSQPASPSAIQGECVVLDASGVYAGLSGTGRLTGQLGSDTLADTIVF